MPNTPNLKLTFLPGGKLATLHGDKSKDAQDLKTEAIAAIQTYLIAHGVLAAVGDTLAIPSAPNLRFATYVFGIAKRHITPDGVFYEID